MKNIYQHDCSHIENIKKYWGSQRQSVCVKLGSALIVGSTLLLSACEPKTGETIASADNASTLNGTGITLDNESDNASISEEINAFSLSCRNSLIVNAFEQQQSAVQVKGCGKVKAILADDNQGSRHQRFIVQLEDVVPKHTVLIAHNIDLAPKIETLHQGDDVVFYGQYEYNPQGGVVHWTHHDSAARHQDGWIEHKAQRFQ